METRPTLNTPLGETQKERGREAAPPSRKILSLALMISEFMLWLSLVSESKPSRRAVRKASIVNRWLQLSGDMLKVPFPGVLLL